VFVLLKRQQIIFQVKPTHPVDTAGVEGMSNYFFYKRIFIKCCRYILLQENLFRFILEDRNSVRLLADYVKNPGGELIRL